MLTPVSDPGTRADGRERLVLCLGEAIVDLVCEAEVEKLADARAFVPHFGGALANVAVAASRAGGSAALAGGVGADSWGRWLRERLTAEGVHLDFFSMVEGIQTPIAFVTFDRRREPSFEIYGDGITAGIRSLENRIEEAVDAAGALVLGSNTLVGEPERALTLRARKHALKRGIPVLFDPNLRPNRWPDLDRAVELCRELTAGAAVVRANRDEAALITGGEAAVPESAADALVALGAREAVVTLGADGALARGESAGEAQGEAAEVVSPMGAGDAFMGALAAGLAQRGWELARTAEVLPAACDAGARACESWGAIS
jgi:sugar/nucleoside kinase (ribokinase family)